jgi:hypothetical protein
LGNDSQQHDGSQPPAELVEFMQELEKQGTLIINSAVFNGGFLTGSAYYNYRLTDPVKDKHLYHWRELFYQAYVQIIKLNRRMHAWLLD